MLVTKHPPEINRVAAPEQVSENEKVSTTSRIHEAPKAKHMLATKRIPVSPAVWSELSSLKKAGETYDSLLADMIERKRSRG